MNMQVCMITGDNMHAAYKVADHLNIPRENVTYSAYPDTKRQKVSELQQQGRKVIFVGDGINDGPVLAQAEVGCAINSASDITVGAADLVLMKDDLEDVLIAIKIARKSYQRIKINFFFAFMYNVSLIPVAMGCFYSINRFRLDPMFAAIAMASSSISVVTSSLLLKTYNPSLKIQKKMVTKVQNYHSIDSSVSEDIEYENTQNKLLATSSLNTSTTPSRSELAILNQGPK